MFIYILDTSREAFGCYSVLANHIVMNAGRLSPLGVLSMMLTSFGCHGERVYAHLYGLNRNSELNFALSVQQEHFSPSHTYSKFFIQD